jgi:2-polyprenyl-3-methyl-5-hydroxy-6-metoxy-1,4-benzoquinol methylase
MKKQQRHIAAEQQAFDEILEEFPVKKRRAEAVLARLQSVTTIPAGARILDVGAAAGSFLIACDTLGYRGEGIEPWEEARRNAMKLAEYWEMSIRIVDGTAESIPHEADVFDVVHAASVIEHVMDVERAFAEIYRVLKPGGVFWFETASSMCPRQKEIRGFPLFGWYPEALKLRIMKWAREVKPHLVGYTKTPAIHWFTPSKARMLLQKHGFKKVYERWELRGENEGGRAYRLALRVIRSSRLLMRLADVVVPDCAYAAIK